MAWAYFRKATHLGHGEQMRILAIESESAHEKRVRFLKEVCGSQRRSPTGRHVDNPLRLVVARNVRGVIAGEPEAHHAGGGLPRGRGLRVRVRAWRRDDVRGLWRE